MKPIKIKKKAVVISGTAILKLQELKKEYIAKNKRTITYDAIISKALMKLDYENLIN